MKSPADLLNKKLGKKIAYSGSNEPFEKAEPLPTGISQLDWAIGIGGFPKGRISEIYGLQSCGKSTLMLQAIAHAQKLGKSCCYIDAEFAFDIEYAQKLGVDVKKLLIIRPDCGEEAVEAIDSLLREQMADLIVVDSVSALVPRAEIEAEANKPTMGGQARLMANALRKILAPLSKSNAVLVFINQLRLNIMGGAYDPYTTPGGLSLRFYASTRIEIKKGDTLKKGEEVVGHIIKIRVVKNKVGTPFAKEEIRFMFNEGFSAESDLLTTAEKAGVVKKEGNTYYFGATKLGVGQTKARQFLKENELIADEIRVKL